MTLKIQTKSGDTFSDAGTISIKDGKLVFNIKGSMLLDTFKSVPKDLLNKPEQYMKHIKGRFAMSSTIFLTEVK